LLTILSVLASYAIRFYNNIIGDKGVYSTSAYGTPPTLRRISLTKGLGFYIPLSTLSRLNRNKLVTTYLAIIFLLVNALSRAGLYREVKSSLLTISIPP